MGDDMRQDEPGMAPEGLRGRSATDDGLGDDTEGHLRRALSKPDEGDADTEGHGGGWWSGAKEETKDAEPSKDDDTEGHRVRS